MGRGMLVLGLMIPTSQALNLLRGRLKQPAVLRSNGAVLIGKNKQIPNTQWFTEDEKEMAKVPDQKVVTDEDTCHPKCNWSCDNPTCDAVCEPICSPPKCETRCGAMNLSLCHEKCKKPDCTVICPSQCTKNKCPTCKTFCQAASCEVECRSPPCETVCAPPQCNWTCKNPEKCPEPKCTLKCNGAKSCDVSKPGKLPEMVDQQVLSVGVAKIETPIWKDGEPPAAKGPAQQMVQPDQPTAPEVQTPAEKSTTAPPP